MIQPFRFPIRHLFAITLIVAIVAQAIRLISGSQTAIFVSFLFMVLLALGGLAILGFGILTALAILMSESDENRTYNLRRCVQLSWLGILATLPFAMWIAILIAFQ